MDVLFAEQYLTLRDPFMAADNKVGQCFGGLVVVFNRNNMLHREAVLSSSDFPSSRRGIPSARQPKPDKLAQHEHAITAGYDCKNSGCG